MFAGTVLGCEPMLIQLRNVVVLAAIPIAVACAADSATVATDALPSAPSSTTEDAAPPNTGHSSPTPVPTATATPTDAGVADADAGELVHDPVVFVHGINGSSEDFKVMIGRFILDGWPQDRLSAIDYPDPSLGCNVDNAETLRQHVQSFLAQTGAKKFDLVAHSMGSLSSRKFVRDLGGAAVVSTFVTLGGPHHGIASACLNPIDMCPTKELCATKPFLTALNTAPLTPGPAIWVSMFSHADKTVPWESSPIDGAENIPFDGIDHDGANGLLERPEVYAQVKRVIQYPNP